MAPGSVKKDKTKPVAPFKLRFGAKRLRNFVDNELNDAKREVIGKFCFADLAKISKFNAPDELLEWVVMGIDPKLREYRRKVWKPILFTKDMMQKVFHLPAGATPVAYLKKGDHSDLRNSYRDGDLPTSRAPIALTEGLLKNCADDDVVMINSPPFIKIGGFYSSYPCWQGSLKPRADLDNEIMSLFIESFNLKHKNSRACKRFAFSCVTTDQLSVDPTKFKSKTCMAQFKRACKEGKAAKADLLYFTLVRDNHWVVCTVNLLLGQINVFDSLRNVNSDSLMRSVDNIVANFSKLVNESDFIKRDIAAFDRVDIAEYPQQNTHYDCGFFAMLYMENFDGNIMKHFEESCVPMYRKVVASDLFLHPENEIDSFAALAEQAP